MPTRRSAVCLAAAALAALAGPAAADCIVAPGLPGSGLTMICDADPPNPLTTSIVATDQSDSIGFGPGAGMDTAGSHAISLLAGDDSLTLAGAGGPGDLFDHLDGTAAAIHLGTDGTKSVLVEGKTILSAAGGIEAGAGATTLLEITGSTLTTAGPAVQGGSGDDRIVIVASALTATVGAVAVDGGGGDDVISVGGGAAVAGRIEGGPGDDELAFTHVLDAGSCADLRRELAAADPAGGSIEVARLVYEWAGLETLSATCGLVEVPAFSPGGLAALALLLAALGLGVLRSRPAPAS